MSFRPLIGHRRLVSLLSRAVARGTLPPSLLLAGPAGVGKRRTALAVAKAINCLTPWSGTVDGVAGGESVQLERDACGTCAACSRIERGIHPDVLVLAPDAMGTIKIEVVRDAIDRAGYRPFEARRRVVVIDEADSMLSPAQSALLKTLEEPPASSIFMLVSSMPDALLPTVQSRCPRLRFGALSPAEVAAALVRDHGYTESDAWAAAADADGSIGRALSAQASDLADARAAAQRLLDRAARTSDPARRLDAARELAGGKSGPAQQEERERMAACFRTLASLLRDLGLLAVGADARMLANPDARPQLDALSSSYDDRRTARAYAAVDEAIAALERNASPKIVADWLVLQL
jgi:DNA polymerase-3 subunit delta'